MKVVTAEFIKSATEPSHYPEALLPEIAFAGKSNVGKSSLVNTLVQRKALARTSNTPGRTQLINFFRINDKLLFVDLPGYGYAKVPAAIKNKWGPMMETYLRERSALKLVILILDIRRDISEDDWSIMRWLSYYEIPVVHVLTKADKFSRSQMISRQKQLVEMLQLPPGREPLLFSSKSGMGKDNLWSAIESELA